MCGQIFELASDWSRRLVSETESTVALSEVVERVELTVGGIRVGLKLALPSRDGGPRLDAVFGRGYESAREKNSTSSLLQMS
jgi:hypothetical protein